MRPWSNFFKTIFLFLLFSKIGTAGASDYPLYIRNWSVECDISVAIAYVPAERSDYVVRGWWNFPAPDFQFDEIVYDGSNVVINSNFPWYFYVDRPSGKATGRVAAFKKFTIDGRNLKFIQSPLYPENGAYWLTPSCSRK